MSANLDMGLDEIISGGSSGAARRAAKPKRAEKPQAARAGRGFKKTGPGASTKTLGKAMTAAAAGRNAKPQSKGLIANPLEAARRAVVSHLPTDVSAEDARSFFASRVGRIRQVTGGFRQDGRPSGEFTFTFDAPGKALELMNKFNGQPIDGGKAKLAVQILLDANVAQAPKPLSERIGKLAQAAPQQSQQQAAGAAADKKKRRKNKRTAAAAEAPKPAAKPAAKAEPVKAARNKAKKSTRAPAPRKVRTAADLDAEMSDYFAAADKNEISV